LHKFRDTNTISYLLEHDRANESDGLGLVQSQTSCEALLGQGADLVQLQMVGLARREM